MKKNTISIIIVIALILLAGGAAYFFEQKRLKPILDHQQMEQELISAEYQQTLEEIQYRFKKGELTHEQASALMNEAHQKAQTANIEILDRALTDIMPRH
jgi:hypothetical protein